MSDRSASPPPGPSQERGAETPSVDAPSADTSSAETRDRRRSGARRAAVTASFTYAWLLAGSGVLTPYFPLWLQARGFSAQEMGLLLALPMLMRVVASAPIARLGDGWLGPRRTFLLSSLGTALFFAALTLAHDLWPVAILLVLASAFLAPTAPLLDTIVLEGVVRHGHDYGRIRQWGSFAWLLVSLTGGVVFVSLPRDIIPPVMGAFYAITVLVGLSLPDDRSRGRLEVSDRPDGSAPPRLLFGLVAAAIACLQGAHALLYTFATVIWQQAGFQGAEIGMLWGMGVIFETLAFLLAGWVASRLSPYTLMMAGGVAGLVRWSTMGFAPGSWWLLAALQALHGLSFAAVHLGTMRWLSRYQQGRATRQGMANAAVGAGLTLGTALSGPLYAALGSRGFFVMAVVSLAGMALVAAARAVDQPQRPGSGGESTLPR